ncbi:MAG: 2-C-methyl-D-erythritol 4-phosphate cytidylyltransferase [Bacillota bacterium]|jgi:2-C-methyl-D-erythritol 4-phosphate cytidylyltransferase
MSYVTAVIPAAGQGTRMNNVINKQFLLLQGKPVLAHTLEIFQNCQTVQDVVVVAAAGEEHCCRELVARLGLSKVISIVTGGKERQDSVAKGLSKISPECTLVVVHDGARPLLLPSHLMDVTRTAGETGAAVLAVPVKDTLKIIDKDFLVKKTPDRSTIWAVQTPQAFKKEIIIDCYRRAYQDGVIGTDDASLVERYGYQVKIVPGTYENIKITTPEDLKLAEIILKGREQSAGRKWV